MYIELCNILTHLAYIANAKKRVMSNNNVAVLKASVQLVLLAGFLQCNGRKLKKLKTLNVFSLFIVC